MMVQLKSGKVQENLKPCTGDVRLGWDFKKTALRSVIVITM